MNPTPDELDEILASERAEQQADESRGGTRDAPAPPPPSGPARHPPFEAGESEPAPRAPAPRRAAHPAVALEKYLGEKQAKLAAWAAGRIDPASLVRFALLDYAKSEKLQRCTPESIYLALIACAQVGLEPGGVKQEAFIVPYGTEAQFQLGYRGVITLARRSRLVRAIGANVVYTGDFFDFNEGTEPYVKHRRALEDRGELRCAYAFAKLTNDELALEIMVRAHLDQVRKMASRKGESPAWRDWEDEMYRKAPIKRLGKKLPLGPDFALGVSLDNAAQSGDVAAYRAALAGTGNEVAELVAAAPPPASPPARASGMAGLKGALEGRKAGEP